MVSHTAGAWSLGGEWREEGVGTDSTLISFQTAGQTEVICQPGNREVSVRGSGAGLRLHCDLIKAFVQHISK